MKPLFHFPDLWKNFVKLFKNVDRVATEDGDVLLAEDNVVVDGNLAFSGDMFPGQDSKIYGFENIVDKDGNKRFAEDDIEIQTITGVTLTYGKWSLSGTHLLVVMCLSLADTTVLADGTLLANIALPDYIKSKIVPVWGTSIEAQAPTAYSSDWGTQAFSVVLKKVDAGLQIVKVSNLTLTNDRNVRIQFDLLIDNE